MQSRKSYDRIFREEFKSTFSAFLRFFLLIMIKKTNCDMSCCLRIISICIGSRDKELLIASQTKLFNLHAFSPFANGIFRNRIYDTIMTFVRFVLVATKCLSFFHFIHFSPKMEIHSSSSSTNREKLWKTTFSMGFSSKDISHWNSTLAVCQCLLANNLFTRW